MTVLIFDQCVGTPVTDIDGRSPSPTNVPSTAWNKNGGVWNIVISGTGFYAFNSGNPGGNNGGGAYCDPGVADYILEFDLVVASSPGTVICGPFGRWVDTNNSVFAWVRNDTNRLQIFDRIAGINGSPIADTAYTLPTNTTVHVTFVLSGSSVSVQFGSTMTSGVVTNITGTKGGVHDVLGSADTSVEFVNIQYSTSGGGGGGIGGTFFLNEQNLYSKG